MDEEEHEIYVGYIPDVNEMEADSATRDSAAAKNLGEMKKRLKDLEDEVVALREMVAKAEKEMSAAQDASMEDGCEGVSPSLPDEVLTEILVRLPVKSLVRFKTISKSWCALISSPNFVNQHMNHDHEQTMLVQSFIPLNPDDEDDVRGDFALSLDDPDSSDFRRLSVIPFIEPCGELGGHRLVILGPCNGLVFILQHSHTSMLCNPALQEFKVLPPRAVPSPHTRYDILSGYGFGFDQVTGSYKVVCIYECRSRNSPRSSFTKVELYDSRSNSWRFIDSTHEMLPHACARPEIFFKGACHWYANPHYRYRGVVLCFDVSTEVFRHFEVPELSDGKACGGLSVLRDRLALVRHPGFRQPPSCIDIWVMEEYGVKESWAQAFKIELNRRVRWFSLLWKDELVLVGDDDCEPAFLDLCSGELRRAFTWRRPPFDWKAIVFKESLVSLDQVIHVNAQMDKPWWRFPLRDHCHIRQFNLS